MVAVGDIPGRALLLSAPYAVCATVRPGRGYPGLDIGYVPINPTKPDRVGDPLAWEVIGVIDTEGDCAEWTFPAEPGAVRAARSVVRARLHTWGLDSLADTTCLLVSELVTNALRHATGPIGVRLVRPPGRDGHGVLRVEVSDPLPDPPRERTPHPEDESGRGLQLVASASRRWGTRPAGGDTTGGGTGGKTVWFELSLPG